MGGLCTKHSCSEVKFHPTWWGRTTKRLPTVSPIPAAVASLYHHHPPSPRRSHPLGMSAQQKCNWTPQGHLHAGFGIISWRSYSRLHHREQQGHRPPWNLDTHQLPATWVKLAHATLTLLMLPPALTTLRIMEAPTSHAASAQPVQGTSTTRAHQKYPAPTGSLLHQGTPGRTAAFRNSIIRKVSVPAWRSGDSLLPSSLIAGTFCALLGIEGKESKKN